METCDVIVCDVDGVINIFADEAFEWNDVQDKRLTIDGKPSTLFTFSPMVAKELSLINARFNFLWLTSWNEKTEFLTQLGFPQADFLPVAQGFETESKIEHIVLLAQTKRVLWIDDFAQEWRTMLPSSIAENVVSLQPNHKQGLVAEDISLINSLCDQ